MARYVDILQLREDLNLPRSIPVPEPDEAYKGRYEDPMATAENGNGYQIGFVDILKLRKEVLSPLHSSPEPNNAEETETLEIVQNNDVLKNLVGDNMPLHSSIICAFHTIYNIGKVHRCGMTALTEVVYVTWSVVAFTPLAQIVHRTARDRWKTGQKLPFRTFCDATLYLLIASFSE